MGCNSSITRLRTLAILSLALLVIISAPSAAGYGDPNTIIGGWIGGDGAVIIAFLDNSRYVLIQDTPADGYGMPGMEMGTYTWNRTTGEFAGIPSVDTNGEWGLSHPSGQTILTINGNDMTLSTTGGDGTHTLQRIVSAPSNPLVGTWWLEPVPGQNGSALVVFLANGDYFHAENGESGEEGHPGIEHGSYTWNPSTKEFSASEIYTDTNGEWGLSHPSAGSHPTASVSGQIMTVDDSDMVITLQLVSQPLHIGRIEFDPPMAAAGDNVQVTVNMTPDSATGSVSVEGVQLADKGDNVWVGNIKAASPPKEHNVSCVAVDVVGNLVNDRSAAYKTAMVVGTSCSNLMMTIMEKACESFLFKCWGNVTQIDEDGFWINDGMQASIKVVTSDYEDIVEGSLVAVRGILEASPGVRKLTCLPSMVAKLK